MREKILWAVIGGSVVFVIEEARALKFMSEMKSRLQNQSIALANIDERLEMLEE